MAFDPTPEQQNIVDAFTSGANLVIEAGAGTGKTSTLKLMAETTKDRGVYIAYNKAIATDAAGSFPSTVKCATAHSFAFRSVGLQYKHRLNGPRVTARDTARILGINDSITIGEGVQFGPDKIARHAMDAISRFCYSADSEISRKHVSKIEGAEAAHDEIVAATLPFAKKAWIDIIDKGGRLKFQHDHYLKLWAMSEPTLQCDYVLLDEAQDANPVIAQVVENQTQAQKIMVGDQSQAIYGWRGAVDAMSSFNADQRLILSQSFRFGPKVAEEANKWLGLLDGPLRLQGFDKIDSKIDYLDSPDAILCRTNAGALARALALQEAGKEVAIVGGTNEIKRFAEGAGDLMSGKRPYHQDLIAFKNWGEVQEYVENDKAGADLKVFVKLIDNYGVDTIVRVANNTVNEDKADTIISTAHKSKGREWAKVQIASDFNEPDQESGESLNRPEMMLSYVAITRARLVLDRSGLAWIDNWLTPKLFNR